jgi:hypothetical protein
MQQRQYITIVSGLPRSGTSMMMRMLTEGGIEPLIDHIREADEDNPRGYYEFEPVKKTKQDAGWVPQAVGKVVKMVHLILKDMPLDYHYRVILMRRHLDEVVKSQNAMLTRRGKETDTLPADRMKEIFQSQIKDVQNHMNQHADHFQWIEIDYNEALHDPKTAIENVNDFLKDLDTEKMLAVVDPTLYRNRAT